MIGELRQLKRRYHLYDAANNYLHPGSLVLVVKYLQPDESDYQHEVVVCATEFGGVEFSTWWLKEFSYTVN